MNGRRKWRALGWSLLLTGGAALVRLHRFSRWSFAGDELFTLRDSLDPAAAGFVRPLLFWMNSALVEPWQPLDEFGLRLLPVVFGIVAVPITYLLGRKVVSDRAALAAAGLVLLSPWHLYWSQTARYYTLVFLLSLVFALATFVAAKRRSLRWGVVAGVAFVLAVLAHPTAVLLGGGCALWVLLPSARRIWDRRRSPRRGDLVALGVLLLAMAGGALHTLPILVDWFSKAQPMKVNGVGILISYVVRVGPGVALAAAVGVLLIWRDGGTGETRRASYFVLALVVPLGVVAMLAFLVMVHSGYLFATAPLVFLAAGAFVDRAAERAEGRWSRTLLSGALFLLVALPGLPRFVSHYVDGTRPDYRSAAAALDRRHEPGDAVLSDQLGTLRYYLSKDVDLAPFRRDTAVLDSVLRSLRAAPSTGPGGRAGPGSSAGPGGVGRLWLVAYYRSQGGFGVTDLGPAHGWVRDHCLLEKEISAVRIDYVRNDLRLFMCSRPVARLR